MPSPSAADDGRLVLIGTVHRGVTALPALRRLLNDLRPSTVTVEFSPYGLAYRRTRGPRLRRAMGEILAVLAAERGRPLAELHAHPQIAAIRELLALPFEYRAAAEYARKTPAALALVDLSAISAVKLRRVEDELLTAANLRTLVDLPAPGRAAEGVGAARSLVLADRDEAIRQAFLAGRRGEEGVGRRDRHMAGEIRRLLGASPGRLVHIGGWVHLVEDRQGETLYSLLADLRPRRLILEVDSEPVPDPSEDRPRIHTNEGESGG
jgi:hypothetical protein